MVGKIYVGYHLILLLRNYISCGHHVLREEDFLKVVPNLSPWELLIPEGVASLDPMGLIGKILYETTRYILPHTNIHKIWVSCFFKVFPKGDLCCHGNQITPKP